MLATLEAFQKQNFVKSGHFLKGRYMEYLTQSNSLYEKSWTANISNIGGFCECAVTCSNWVSHVTQESIKSLNFRGQNFFVSKVNTKGWKICWCCYCDMRLCIVLGFGLVQLISKPPCTGSWARQVSSRFSATCWLTNVKPTPPTWIKYARMTLHAC